ncbi:MAG: lytic murein transglycosylase [Aeromicrobium sp.]|uniref:lytic transglycosylase domain-containing protein n=1 Tax=Aeromicrobium sp. TaxID=1871063 RepID=UPI0039E6CEE1
MFSSSSRVFWISLAVPVALGLLGLAAIVVAAVRWNRPSEGLVEQAPSSTASEPSAVGSGEVGVDELADPVWVEQTAASTGIPRRALAAYAGASIAVATTHPSCSLGWTTLAGIGHVESGHGTIFGGSIGDDGLASPAIIGIALDGDGVAAISDSDDGELDGDTHWDRAVGPMQFIPSTWELYAADGDGDGEADPQDVDDASLAAAVYLCEAGGDLSSDQNWIAAVSAYNASVDYNNRVVAAADHYAALS